VYKLRVGDLFLEPSSSLSRGNSAWAFRGGDLCMISFPFLVVWFHEEREESCD
jgi:hypothetical protein